MSHGPRRPAHDPNTPRPPVCATPTCAGNSPHRPSPSSSTHALPTYSSCANIRGRAPFFSLPVAITAYQNEGHTVEDQHLAHISPARFEHINPYSTYNLNVEAVLQRIRHRPSNLPNPLDEVQPADLGVTVVNGTKCYGFMTSGQYLLPQSAPDQE